MRKYLHVTKIVDGYSEPSRAVFLTLTSKPNREWSDVMKAWQAMVRWMRLANPDLAYVAVKEEGKKTGMRHLHILLTSFDYVPQKQLSAAWSRYSGASIVWIERVSTKVPVAYLTKYLTKYIGGEHRLVNYSRNWPKLPPAPVSGRLLGRAHPEDPPPILYTTNHGYLAAKVHEDCDCWGQWFETEEQEAWHVINSYRLRNHGPPAHPFPAST